MKLLVLVETATLAAIATPHLAVGDIVGTAQQQLLDEIAARLGDSPIDAGSRVVVVNDVGMPRASEIDTVQRLVRVQQAEKVVLVFTTSAPHDRHVAERLMLRVPVHCWQLVVEDDVFYLQEFSPPTVATVAIRRA